MPPRKRAETKPDEFTAPVGDRESDEPTPDAPSASGDDPDRPKKSDLQAVEQPCPICIPNGWTEGAFAMGCEHGTWVRDSA